MNHIPNDINELYIQYNIVKSQQILCTTREEAC